jgi:hypothetical protein
MGPYHIDELDTAGTVNGDGFRIVRMEKDGVGYQPVVEADRLKGYAYIGGALLEHTALENAEIRLEYTDTTGVLRDAQIRIVHVSPQATSAVKFWIGPADRIETYKLEYTGVDMPPNEYHAVCNNPPALRDGEGNDWLSPFEAILFTGDRYDRDSKTVVASSYATAGTWFNVACAGSATAKLHLNRHTTAGTTTGYTTTWPQRQAMLKMYTGDFCGTGTAYTVAGTKLFWSNSKGWSSPYGVGNQNSYESLWSSAGAICLDTHRLHGLYPTDFQAIIQGSFNHGVWWAACPKPSCDTIAGFPAIPRSAYLETMSAAFP